MFIVNVEAAIFKGDEWLLIKRSKKEEHAGGMLSLVGGKVDTEGFSVNILERTIKREILEEVGVSVKEQTYYVQSSSFVTDKGNHVVNIVFLCEYHDGEAIPNSPDEVEQVMWLTTEEIVSDPSTPAYLQESIKRAEELKVLVFEQMGGRTS